MKARKQIPSESYIDTILQVITIYHNHKQHTVSPSSLGFILLPLPLSLLYSYLTLSKLGSIPPTITTIYIAIFTDETAIIYGYTVLLFHQDLAVSYRHKYRHKIYSNPNGRKWIVTICKRIILNVLQYK